MSIVRVSKRENPYVTIDKTCVNDDRLSWKAKGLHTYLMSKPNAWSIRVKDLIKRGVDGRDSCYAGLKELEQFGYLERIKTRNPQGQFEHESVVYEIPQTEHFYLPTVTENPDTVKPDSENPEHINKGFSNFLNTNSNTNRLLSRLPKAAQTTSHAGEDFFEEESGSTREDEISSHDRGSLEDRNEKKSRSQKSNPTLQAPLPKIEVVSTPRKQQQPIRMTINDDGWLQMPKAKKYSLARAVTVRRMQYRLAERYSGVMMTQKDGGIFVSVDDRDIPESEAFAIDGEFSLTLIRNDLFDDNMISQKAFNDVLLHIFESSIEWCAIQGANASRILKSSSLAHSFYSSDKDAFKAILDGRR